MLVYQQPHCHQNPCKVDPAQAGREQQPHQRHHHKDVEGPGGMESPLKPQGPREALKPHSGVMLNVLAGV